MNDEQREYWNGPGGERWVTEADRMDRSLRPLAQAALAVAAPRPGERVLDVGCGAGATTRMLKQLVGAEGAVLGLDISEPQIAAARERGGDVQYAVGDAAIYELPRGAFQLVFSRFGVMFFDDPVPAFANLRRGLAQDGRLAFVCWRVATDNPWVSAPVAAARDLLPQTPPPPPDAPGPFAFADETRVRSILTGAGFSEIHLARHDDSMWIGDSVDQAVASILFIGPLARAASELPDATRAQIRDRLRALFERYTVPASGEVALPCSTWLVTARK